MLQALESIQRTCSLWQKPFLDHKLLEVLRYMNDTLQVCTLRFFFFFFGHGNIAVLKKKTNNQPKPLYYAGHTSYRCY